MFIRIFRSKYFFNYLLFFIIAIALWFDVLINPEKIKPSQLNTGAAWLDAFFTGFPLITVILAIGLLIFQALVFNQIHDNHRLAERNQMLVAAFYILLMSSTPVLVRPTIMIIVNFLMIILMNTMLNILGKHEPYRQVFDAGFLVGIASLLYFPAVVFLASDFYLARMGYFNIRISSSVPFYRYLFFLDRRASGCITKLHHQILRNQANNCCCKYLCLHCLGPAHLFGFNCF